MNLSSKFNQFEIRSYNKFLEIIKESLEKFSKFYAMNTENSLLMIEFVFQHLKNTEQLMLNGMFDMNVFSTQLSRALLIVSKCIINSDTFNYHFEIYSSKSLISLDIAESSEIINTQRKIKIISIFFELLVNVDKYSQNLTDKNFINLEMTILLFLNSIMTHALTSLEVKLISSIKPKDIIVPIIYL